MYPCTLHEIYIMSSASLTVSGSFQFPAISFISILERDVGQCNITSPNGNYLSVRKLTRNNLLQKSKQKDQFICPVHRCLFSSAPQSHF